MSGPAGLFDTGKLAGSRTKRGYNQSTASGRPFWSLLPNPGDIRPYDIVAQLSRICRFNGALRHDVALYSVAQHCCLVSDHLPPELRYEGLLHDAHEAYIGDMIKPMKMNMASVAIDGQDPWAVIERRLEAAIRTRFGLPATLTPAVKEQDWRAFPTEVRDLCPPMRGVDHGKLPEPWGDLIIPWCQQKAFVEFLTRLEHLMPVQVAAIFTLNDFIGD